jgi:hypothetical protein
MFPDSRFTKLLSGILIFCILFSSQIALAQTSTYYTPGNTNYVSNNTFGGQVFNSGASILIGCTSGVLAGQAAKGIASLSGTLTKNKLTDVGSKAGVNLQSNSEVKVSDKQTNENTAQANKISACLDAAAYQLAQSTLQGMSQRVLNWVNTGLGGNPLYVKDVGSYLTSIQNQKISDFLSNNGMNNSVYGQAVNSVIRQATTGFNDNYFSKINGTNYKYTYTTAGQATLYCADDYQTLYSAEDAACLKKKDPTGATDPVAICRAQIRVKYDNLAAKNCVGQTVKKFNDFQGDFTQGGWDAFLNSIQNDNNNPIGALFKASDQLSNSIGQQQKLAQDEINRNGGFLDMKVCAKWENSKFQAYCENPENAINPACTAQDSAAYCSANPNNPACQLGSTNKEPRCLAYQTTTPGQVIANSVNEITKTPIVNAENITQINQVLSSFFSSLLNNFLQGGLGLLQNKGGSVPSYAVSYGTNTVYSADGSSYQNPFANITQNSYDVAQFDISRPQDLRAVIQAQADYVNKLQDARNALEKLVPYTGELDYLLPGPNPTWTDYVDQNFNELMNSLIVEDNDGHKQKFVGNAIEQTGATVGSILAVTGVGSVVGAIVIAGSFIVGEVIKLIKNNHFRFWFESPTLTDKATGGTVTVGILPNGRHYDSYSNGSDNGNNPILYFEHAYNVLRIMYSSAYKPSDLQQKLGNAYAAIVTSQADKDFARGFVTQALAAVSKLPQYAQSAPQVEDDYTAQIAETQNTVVQLNNIMDQINTIVSTAKTRYITQQKANGTPVDVNTVAIDTRTGSLATDSTPAANRKVMSCIDYAYQINTTPIVGTPRQTTDLLDPVVVKSEAASDYFYGSMQVNP